MALRFLPGVPLRFADGGPIRYRVLHDAKLWKKGEKPVLVQQVAEGNAGLSI